METKCGRWMDVPLQWTSRPFLLFSFVIQRATAPYTVEMKCSLLFYLLFDGFKTSSSCPNRQTDCQGKNNISPPDRSRWFSNNKDNANFKKFSKLKRGHSLEIKEDRGM